MPPQDSVVQILLVEEEALVRAALQALVTSWPGFHVVAEAATRDEAGQQLRRVQPHVVLVSLGGIEDSDLKTVRELTAISGHARLLTLVGDCNKDFRLQIIRNGARGVVLRRKPASEQNSVT